MPSSTIPSFAGIALFMGLTAYQTQRIKRWTTAALQQGDQQTIGRVGIWGIRALPELHQPVPLAAEYYRVTTLK